MIMTGLARLGRDAELRYLPNGDAVCNLALASNYGKKDADGNRPTQWVDATLWGKRVEALVGYLLKGTQVDVVLEGPHIETYTKGDGGTGFKLVARVINIGFAGNKQASEQAPRQAPPPPTPPRPAPRPAPASSGFDDMDDDTIPF